MGLFPLWDTIRRNHGVEHATLQILAQRRPGIHLIGRSDPQGFVVYGDVDTEELANATTEALARLQQGDDNLAVHPNCGTNLSVAGFTAGLLAWAASRGKRKPWDAIPAAMIGATLGVILAKPLGPIVQKYVTVSSEVNGMRVVEVTRQDVSGVVRHRVKLAH